MREQNYAHHRRYVPLYHGVLFLLIVVATIGAVVDLARSAGEADRVLDGSLHLLFCMIALLLFWYARAFALRAQDRAIRAEEQIRHMVLTGKPLDPRLTMRQIIGLRFAHDEEFPVLARRAVEEQLSEEEIKRAVKRWRADHHRA